MKEFLDYLVNLIVDPSSKFEINEENLEGAVSYTILVPEEEFGKVIGKGGKVINAIRVLCRLKANQSGQRVMVKVDKL